MTQTQILQVPNSGSAQTFSAFRSFLLRLFDVTRGNYISESFVSKWDLQELHEDMLRANHNKPKSENQNKISLQRHLVERENWSVISFMFVTVFLYAAWHEAWYVYYTASREKWNWFYSLSSIPVHFMT